MGGWVGRWVGGWVGAKKTLSMTPDWAPLTPFVLAGVENRFPVFPEYLNFVVPLESSFIF